MNNAGLEFVGSSQLAHSVREQVIELATTRETVLIVGETGTGKEVVAKLLHRHSSRSTGPLVAISCATLERSTIDTELFGSVSGSFTDVKDRPGAFEKAHKGTLFLDEIGELPPEIQAKLLRAIEERAIRRLGSSEEHAVDVRIVAATNRNLQAMILEGRFREDLWYRFEAQVELPRLRDRIEDVPELLTHLITRERQENSRHGEPETVAASAIDHLQTRRWRGNVRDLRSRVLNALRRARAAGRTVLALEDFELSPELDELPFDPSDDPLVRYANDVLDRLDRGELPAMSIAKLVDRMPRLRMDVRIAEVFLERPWNKTEKARRLFGYKDADAVRQLLDRARKVSGQ